MVKKPHHEEEDEEEDEDIAIKDTRLPNYLLGSLCTDFGIHASLLSSQLELHSREEKINQIILLKVGEFFSLSLKISKNSHEVSYKGSKMEISCQSSDVFIYTDKYLDVL